MVPRGPRAGTSTRDGGQCWQRQRLYRAARARGGRGDRGARGGAFGVPALRHLRCIDRGDRRAAADRQGRGRTRCRLRRRAVLVGGGRQHNRHDRHFREGRDDHGDRRWPHRHAGRHRQRVRDDCAGYGDDAGLYLYRCRGRSGVPAGSTRRSEPRELLVHHGRQRHLDQRHCPCLRQRGGGQCAANRVRGCRGRCLSRGVGGLVPATRAPRRARR